MTINAADVEGFALKLIDGTAKVFPVTAPIMVLIKGILEVADEYGIIPHELPAEQVAAMAAGLAALRASAITSDRARRR
jgi:hypothetical protein